MINTVKELRVKIDGLYQLTNSLNPLSTKGTSLISKWNTQEIKESAKSLLLAKAWLGKLLGELGSDNPYSSDKKEVKDIEPTADTASETVWASYMDFQSAKDEYAKFNHIQKVDWIRSEIQKVIDEVKAPDFATDFNTRETTIARTNSYNHLCEARFWLGFELQRLREEG